MRIDAYGVGPPPRVYPGIPQMPGGIEAHRIGGGQRPFPPGADNLMAMQKLHHEIVGFAHGAFLFEQSHGLGNGLGR